MKLKSAGKIWEVDYIVATSSNKRARCRFYSDYELIPDGPQSSYDPHARIDTLREAIGSNTRSIVNLTAAHNGVLDRLHALESDNQRLKDRLNKIEGLGIQR